MEEVSEEEEVEEELTEEEEIEDEGEAGPDNVESQGVDEIEEMETFEEIVEC